MIKPVLSAVMMMSDFKSEAVIYSKLFVIQIF